MGKFSIKDILCRFFGHVPGETWEHEGTNSVCVRCRIVYKSGGFYKLRSFKNAVDNCGTGESIYRSSFCYNKYAKNHTIPIKKRVRFLDRISRDWVISSKE